MSSCCWLTVRLVHWTFVISSFRIKHCTLQTSDDKKQKDTKPVRWYTRSCWSLTLGENCVCINFIWVSVIYLFICHCIITHRKNDLDLYAGDLCLLVIFGDTLDKVKCVVVSAASSSVLKTVLWPAVVQSHGFESVKVIRSHVCFVPFLYECA